MYSISNIPQDREKKLKTLLSDEVDSVISEFQNKLKLIKQHVDTNRVQSALDFALSQDYGHGPLVKYYVTHPIRVAIFVMDWMILKQDYSTDFLVATLIHNVIEKGILTESELEKKYNHWMSHTIAVLTQDREALKDHHKKEAYYENIYNLDKYGQLIKFFDKFDNLYAICLNPSKEIREQYIHEIEVKITPIALKFAPEFNTYFLALIKEMKQFGHYHPSFE